MSFTSMCASQAQLLLFKKRAVHVSPFTSSVVARPTRPSERAGRRGFRGSCGTTRIRDGGAASSMARAVISAAARRALQTARQAAAARRCRVLITTSIRVSLRRIRSWRTNNAPTLTNTHQHGPKTHKDGQKTHQVAQKTSQEALSPDPLADPWAPRAPNLFFPTNLRHVAQGGPEANSGPPSGSSGLAHSQNDSLA